MIEIVVITIDGFKGKQQQNKQLFNEQHPLFSSSSLLSYFAILL